MTAPVSSRETGTRVPVQSTAEICTFVDRVGRGAVGEIVIRSGLSSPEVCGIVFVESGRVCWAAARGLAPRLTELLMARSTSADARAMEKLFRQCRDEQVPLGEFLVARGVVAPHDFRAALFDHTVESLEQMCSPSALADWRARPGLGYSPRFTFSTAEVFVRASSRALPPKDRKLVAEVEAFLPTAFSGLDWGAAFTCVSDGLPLPIVGHGALPETTSDLLRVGRWAFSRLDAAASIGASGALVTATARDSSARDAVFVAFHFEVADARRTIVAGRTSAEGPARILNRRSRVRKASG